MITTINTQTYYLYLFGSCSLISFFGTLALSGWMTSTTCAQGEGTRRVMGGRMTEQGSGMVERLRVMEGKDSNDEGDVAVEEIR